MGRVSTKLCVNARTDAIAHTFPLKPSRMAEDDVEHWKGLAEERLKT